MNARHSATRTARRRRASHLALVQTHPTRPSLPVRMRRALSVSRAVVACGLALAGLVTIYVMRSHEPQRAVKGTVQPRDAAREGKPAESTQKLASTQPHVLMARVY
jgi:hypothetical protein